MPVDTLVKPCRKCGGTDWYPSGICRPCQRDRNRQNYQANKASILVRTGKRQREKRGQINAERRRWYAANAEKERARALAWQRNNRDIAYASSRRWHKENPEKSAEGNRNWHKANPGKNAEYNARRRTRKLGAQGTHTEVQWAARSAYFGDKCWMCDGPATAVEHVIALCNGGTNWPANLRPACTSCNAAKLTMDRRNASVREILQWAKARRESL